MKILVKQTQDVPNRQEGENKMKWINAKEKLPKPEQRVLACTESSCAGCIYKHITAAMYEDGTMWMRESEWSFSELGYLNYDEDKDDFKIPAGWWEYTIYNEEQTNYPIDDAVTHWMPLPDLPEEE